MVGGACVAVEPDKHAIPGQTERVAGIFSTPAHVHFIEPLCDPLSPCTRGDRGRGEGGRIPVKARRFAHDLLPPHPSPSPPSTGERGEPAQLVAPKLGWHALRYSEGRGYSGQPRPSESLMPAYGTWENENI